MFCTVGIAERLRRKAVPVRRRGTRNHSVIQLRVIADIDVVATVARVEAALLVDRLVIVLDGLVTRVRRAADGRAVADRRHAEARLEPRARLLAVVHVCILLARDIQIAADVRIDRIARHLRTTQVRVAPARQRHRVSGIDLRIAIGHAVAVGMPIRTAGREFNSKAVLLPAQPKANPDAATAAAVAARLLARILRVC